MALKNTRVRTIGSTIERIWLRLVWIRGAWPDELIGKTRNGDVVNVEMVGVVALLGT